MGSAGSCCTPGGSGETTATPDGAIIRSAEAAARLRRQCVALGGAAFRMGSEDPDANPHDGEGPIRTVHVEPFLISPTAVTNTQFATFVKKTRYRTTAERLGWSYVFAGFVPHDSTAIRGTAEGTPWWLGVDGANWRQPEGPGSTITHRQNHPVVHVSHDDALAYCAWAGARLPTETEWEYAARGGLDGARYPWGDELRPRGRHMCNIWQGTFPTHNTCEDGHAGTAPVNAYRPNGFGLFNMVGNVWEWNADAWSVGGDPPPGEDDFVMRGGSYLCHDSYCNRYRVAARTHNPRDATSGNCGFRCAMTLEE